MMIAPQSQAEATFREKRRYAHIQNWLKVRWWKHNLLFPWLCLLCILFVYGGLLLPTVGRQGISWDVWQRCHSPKPSTVMLIIDLTLCYPDYNLNGFQWLGYRMLAGRASVGYRSVVQTPSDGVEQVMVWLNEHAKEGERVRAYILPCHIVQAVAPHPVYKLENALQGQVSADPDYVVIEINTQIKQNWWIDSSKGNAFRPLYDPAWLELKYDKVFSVKRAFGIEMASVYRNK